MRLLALLCFAGALSCKTAEYRSIPGPDKSLNASTEIAATVPDPIPTKVSAPDPVRETTVNPTTAQAGMRTEDKTETFVQENKRDLSDILIVIDDSDSMRQEQKNLSSKMSSLLKSLQDVNWQIAVITTSALPSGECKLSLIKAGDSDAESRFAEAIEAGTKGSGNEQGILQSVVGLKCKEQPWIRENSSLAVLIVSDEDNCSNGMGCNNSPALSERYLIDYVEKDLGRTIGLDAGFYGIYSPPNDECENAPAPAHIYQNLIEYRQAAAKNYGRICEDSYESTLEKMSQSISELLKNTFELQDLPIRDSVRVEGKKGNGKLITMSDYLVIGKVIGFKTGSEPMRGSTISVKYQHIPQ